MADRWGHIGKISESTLSSRSAHWDRSSTLIVGESDTGAGVDLWQDSVGGLAAVPPAHGQTPLPSTHSQLACPFSPGGIPVSTPLARPSRDHHLLRRRCAYYPETILPSALHYDDHDKSGAAHTC